MEKESIFRGLCTSCHSYLTGMDVTTCSFWLSPNLSNRNWKVNEELMCLSCMEQSARKALKILVDGID